jgi:hypothetical protein
MTQGGGAVMLRPIICQCDGVWISTGFPCEHVTACILSVSTCAKFDLTPEGDSPKVEQWLCTYRLRWFKSGSLRKLLATDFTGFGWLRNELAFFLPNYVACNAVESSWNVMAHGDARKQKWRGNKRMEWVTSKRHMTAEHRLARVVQTLRCWCAHLGCQ